MKIKSSKEKLDEVSLERFGRKRSECLDEKICVMCGDDASSFKDRESRHEYLISAACQSCQDFMFEEEEEEPKQETLWC